MMAAGASSKCIHASAQRTVPTNKSPQSRDTPILVGRFLADQPATVNSAATSDFTATHKPSQAGSPPSTAPPPRHVSPNADALLSDAADDMDMNSEMDRSPYALEECGQRAGRDKINRAGADRIGGHRQYAHHYQHRRHYIQRLYNHRGHSGKLPLTSSSSSLSVSSSSAMQMWSGGRQPSQHQPQPLLAQRAFIFNHDHQHQQNHHQPHRNHPNHKHDRAADNNKLQHRSATRIPVTTATAPSSSCGVAMKLAAITAMFLLLAVLGDINAGKFSNVL